VFIHRSFDLDQQWTEGKFHGLHHRDFVFNGEIAERRVVAALEDLLSFRERFVDEGDLGNGIDDDAKANSLSSTHIINSQHSIARFDPASLVGRSISSHVRHDDRHLRSAAQRQSKASILPFDCHLRQFRRDAQAILRDC
jgi:hypothetical protein